MYRIRIIVVGGTRSPFLRQGEEFYLKRLRRYSTTEWIEVKTRKSGKGRSTDEILSIEGTAIGEKLHGKDYVTALDPGGRQYDSEGLARWIQNISITRKSLCFIIGGHLGLSKRILHSADQVLSLSPLTLTHEMSRLLLLEQLYRAHTIIRGEKYHK